MAMMLIVIIVVVVSIVVVVHIIMMIIIIMVVVVVVVVVSGNEAGHLFNHVGDIVKFCVEEAFRPVELVFQTPEFSQYRGRVDVILEVLAERVGVSGSGVVVVIIGPVRSSGIGTESAVSIVIPLHGGLMNDRVNQVRTDEVNE